ncbi:MAG: hypothetical protein M3N95_07740 [Actinomycetota bacterium]|nr:hypothetical protein [Actinomycetota bacterium]
MQQLLGQQDFIEWSPRILHESAPIKQRAQFELGVGGGTAVPVVDGTREQ